MPVTKRNAAPILGIAEVFEVTELGNLAFEWARSDADFTQAALLRYRELCERYDVSEAVLLHAAQTRLTRDLPQEQTGIIPVVPDVADAG